METPLPTMRDLAQRLLTGRPSASAPAQTPGTAGVMATERLKTVLVRFVGSEGYASLMRRALTLSSGEMPLLRTVKVGSDGLLKGLEQLARDAGMNQAGVDEVQREAVVAITGHLLGLLETFVGESLTLQMVRKTWPDISLEEFSSRAEAG